MKIKIIKEGLKNADTNKYLKLDEVIDVSKERGLKAIELERAVEVKETKKKKSQQKKVEDKLEKK